MASSRLFSLGHSEAQRTAALVALAEAAAHVAAVSSDMLKMEGKTGVCSVWWCVMCVVWVCGEVCVVCVV